MELVNKVRLERDEDKSAEFLTDFEPVSGGGPGLDMTAANTVAGFLRAACSLKMVVTTLPGRIGEAEEDSGVNLVNTSSNMAPSSTFINLLRFSILSLPLLLLCRYRPELANTPPRAFRKVR